MFCECLMKDEVKSSTPAFATLNDRLINKYTRQEQHLTFTALKADLKTV